MSILKLSFSIPEKEDLVINLEDTTQVKSFVTKLKNEQILEASKSYVLKTKSGMTLSDASFFKDFRESEYVIVDEANVETFQYNPTGIKVPKVFHQLGILVLDGSESMNWMGPFNMAKYKHVSGGVVELLNRMNVSRIKQNFSFACIKFDQSATVTLTPTAFDYDTFMKSNFDSTAGKGGGTCIFNALEDSYAMAEKFLADAPPGGLTHSVLILLMSDGECSNPGKTKLIADKIKANPKIQIACAYFAEVGKVNTNAQNLLKESASDLGSGPAFTTVYDGEALRAFFERSISQSSGVKIQ
jgi:von Willebrand factor type A domain